MMDKTVKRHLDAIERGSIDKSNVIGIRKILNHAARLSAGWSGNRSNATIADSSDIMQAIWTHKPLVTGALHESGLDLLRNKRYRNRFDARQTAIISAMNNPQFRLVDFEEVNRTHYVPVYEISSRAGKFSFRNVPWQSGGNGPEIV